MPIKDEIGNTYTRLTVISREFVRRGKSHWRCVCICGNIAIVWGPALRNGGTKSCGCISMETSSIQGKSNTKINRYDLSGYHGIGYTSKNEEFYFDINDFDKIKNYHWSLDKSGYVKCKRNVVTYMHRIVMNTTDDMFVDHIHHIKHDNRKSELRNCTPSQNNMNRSLQSNNTSGYCGVSWSKSNSKWCASITIDDTKILLGYFTHKELAISARNAAEIEYFGIFKYESSSND